MNLDDKLCLCFGVSKRKVINFIRVEKPKRAGQLAECFGAGTGCGWCRKYLTRLFEVHSECESGMDNQFQQVDIPSPQEYAELREAYMDRTGRRPPSD